jgi:hypothetical protein
MESVKSELRKQIEEALEKAGLGRKFDRDIPVLAVVIYREQIKEERENA